MSLVQIGDYEIDARPYVLEAVQWFGTICPGKVEDYLSAFVEAFRGGQGGRGVCGIGRKMTWQEREALGIKISPMSWDAYELLIEPARADAPEALIAISGRVSGRLYQERHRQALDDLDASNRIHYGMPVLVEFMAEIHYRPCELAKLLTGKIMFWSEAPRLPLNECGQDYCACNFRKLKIREHLEYMKQIET